jgi:tRNA(Ile)-lysidine synthase
VTERGVGTPGAGGPGWGGPGFAIVEAARDAIRRHHMLEGSERVVVGLSGGPDSTCLVDVLVRLSDPLDLELVIAHVDHGLSENSAEIAAQVASRSAQAGHDVHVMRISDLEGPNLQARARALRYEFMHSLATRMGAERIATGHTLDDRAETTLARLVHGGGTDVLAGLPPVEGNRIRPLIEVRRSETRAYCEVRGLSFEDDPANENLDFERVAVRRLLVPVIEERWGPGAMRAIATSAQRLSEDAAGLRQLAARLYESISEESEGGVRFPLESVMGVPRALRRRLLERAVGRVRDRAGGIDAALEALDRSRGAEARFSVAGGREIVITSTWVEVAGASGPAAQGPGQ